MTSKNIAYQKIIKRSTIVYLVLLFTDYITTLCSLTQSGTYTSKMGLIFHHTMTTDYIETSFGISSKLFLFYIVIVAIFVILAYLKSPKPAN
ncbi:MAG: hypothetical protein ACK5I7_06120 [Anaerotignum sp.]